MAKDAMMLRLNRKTEPMDTQDEKQLGFTLIEVLTVAAIVAILATVAVASMRGGRRIAFETRAIAAMKNVAENEVIFFQRASRFGTWTNMVNQGDLIDPGYDKIDSLSDPYDAPIANLYSVAIYTTGVYDSRIGPQHFTAVAFPLEQSIWHMRTYAVTDDGGILNSHDHGRFFSTLPPP